MYYYKWFKKKIKKNWRMFIVADLVSLRNDQKMPLSIDEPFAYGYGMFATNIANLVRSFSTTPSGSPNRSMTELAITMWHNFLSNKSYNFKLSTLPLSHCDPPKMISFVWLIWFFTSHPQSFSYVGTGLSWLNQY